MFYSLLLLLLLLLNDNGCGGINGQGRSAAFVTLHFFTDWLLYDFMTRMENFCF